MQAISLTPRSANPQPKTRPSAWPLLVVLLAAIAGLLIHGPIAQPATYHQFADARVLFGMPNMMDVLTNLPFLLIGLAGLWALRRQQTAAAPAWRVLFVAVALTGFTSGYYHWAPDDAGLVFDRATIALACGFMMCAFMAERFDARWAGRPALWAIAFLSLLSVAYWYATGLLGVGDLRPYLIVQLLPLALIPLGLWLTRRTALQNALPAAAWLTPLVLYVLAKACEIADHTLFDVLGIVSGHSIKHLLAAAAVAVFVLAHWRQGNQPGIAQ